MPDTPSNRVDTFIGKLKNNPLVSVILIGGIAIIALASFSDAVARLMSLAPRRPAHISTDPTGLSAPIARDTLQQKYLSRFADETVRLDLAKLWYAVQWKDHFGQERSRDILVMFGRNILRSVDKDAVLFVAGDEDFFPLIYAQEREYLRQDVAVVHFQLLRLPGYRSYVTARLGLRHASEDGDYDVTVRQILKESLRPKFFSLGVGDDPVTDSARHFSLEGLVWRYDPSLVDGPRTDVRITRDLLDRRYDLAEVLDPRGNVKGNFEPPIVRSVLLYYAFSFTSLANAVGADGDRKAMERYRKLGLALDPSIR